ncbi:unnamed protein product, partial [Ectocarpus fasciculatus]
THALCRRGDKLFAGGETKDADCCYGIIEAAEARVLHEHISSQQSLSRRRSKEEGYSSITSRTPPIDCCNFYFLSVSLLTWTWHDCCRIEMVPEKKKVEKKCEESQKKRERERASFAVAF